MRIGGPRFTSGLTAAPKQKVENTHELRIDTEGQAAWAQPSQGKPPEEELWIQNEIRGLQALQQDFQRDLERQLHERNIHGKILFRKPDDPPL